MAKLGKKHNITQWIKRTTELLLEHSATCYKERCTIVASEGKSDYEIHIRKQASELCKDLITNQWKLPGDSMHLIERSDRFFSAGNITTVKEWTKSVLAAIERNNRKIQEVTTDIRKTFPRSASDTQDRNTLAAEFRQRVKKKAQDIRSRIQQNISSLFSRLKH